MQTSIGQDYRRLDSKDLLRITLVRIYEDWEESHNELSSAMFHRVLWRFPSYVETFKHCKLLMSIDGTHLYVVLYLWAMAITQDRNSNILSVAFVVYITPQLGLLVILDKNKSIDAALNADRSDILCQFLDALQEKGLKKLLINATYSKLRRKFAHYFGQLRVENVTITNWLEEMSHLQWTRYAKLLMKVAGLST
ncbi:hypothetical protein Ahy_A06g029179 [Arachis hypogaea]|uniref:Uncharacterized protein n=1 Tax=Arachis hypogaea TaxID=3818 RepID=A0A445CST6_ARAHY|nr:hypothetical protein Ahy_A06g029179 [Arachis hypogaea]